MVKNIVNKLISMTTNMNVGHFHKKKPYFYLKNCPQGNSRVIRTIRSTYPDVILFFKLATLSYGGVGVNVVFAHACQSNF